MQAFQQIRNYIEDKEFHIDIYSNKIHVINYQKIISLEPDKIMIKAPNYKIILLGRNFSLDQLLEQEILLEGTLVSLEVKNE